MRLEITGRHVDITAQLRQLINRRLSKLERLLNDNAISTQVILSKEKYRHRSEIIIHARGDNMLRGMGEGTSWQIAVRDAAAKIEQQAQTLKGKWKERKRRGSAGVRSMSALNDWRPIRPNPLIPTRTVMTAPCFGRHARSTTGWSRGICVNERWKWRRSRS